MHPHLKFERESTAPGRRSRRGFQASLHLTTSALTAGDLRQCLTGALGTEAQNTHPRLGAPMVIPRPGPPGST